jgi:2-aminoadipate transaminase
VARENYCAGAGKARPVFARWLETTNDVTRTFLAAGRIPDLINLGGGLPAPEIYPTAEVAELARQAIAQHPQDALAYGPIEGLPELRDALAARFSTQELRLERDNVLITSGGMQGLDLIGKVLLEHRGLVVGQFPTYLGALDAWRPRSPRYRSVALEAADFDAFAALAGAQFAYTVPNFSNPTGRLVELEMRQALVEAAHHSGTWLIEDDPYDGLLYDGVPLPRMIELSARKCGGRRYQGPVVYMGTLSKSIAPGLRVGWVIADPELVHALTIAKQGSDLCTSGLSQCVALGALRTGLVERQHTVVARCYRGRRDALCVALSRHLTEGFGWQVPVGGMFVWVTAHDPALDTDRLLSAALKQGVCIAPSSVFDASGCNRHAFRLNFTFNPPDRLQEGVRRLATAIQAMRSGND